MKNSNRVIYKGSAREAMQTGVNLLANAVKVTLGPQGRNVVLTNDGEPYMTKDGVSVAKAVKDDNKSIMSAIRLVREVASNTVDSAGDGTTTATVLAQYIVNEGMKAIDDDFKPVDLKKGINLACEKVIEYLEGLAIPAHENSEMLEQVATVSANGDNAIGKLIVEAVNTVGADGIITVEESAGLDTYVSQVKGTQYDTGYLSSYFINNQDKQQIILQDAFVLFYDGHLDNTTEMTEIMGLAARHKRPLLVVAEKISDEVIGLMVLNKRRGALESCAVKAPSYGVLRRDILNDMAALTGGKVFTKDGGMPLNTATIKDFGTIDEVQVSKYSTTLIGGHGEDKVRQERIEGIRRQIDNADAGYDVERLKERIAKLTQGVAVIHVGATSEVEMKEKKDRVDDALAATYAAIAEGVLPGGGVALFSYTYVERDYGDLSEDVKEGVTLLEEALAAPMRRIFKNAGVSVDDTEGRLILSGKPHIGYDASSGRFCNMIESGILDPMKVTRTALQNAASIASMILTTECVVDSDTVESQQYAD